MNNELHEWLLELQETLALHFEMQDILLNMPLTVQHLAAFDNESFAAR